MLTVFAAYYKQIGGGKEFIKFFESRQDAEVYLISDAIRVWKEAKVKLKVKQIEGDFENENR